MIKKNNINIESLLVPANIFRIACVDERKVQEVNKTNPVNLPGATYCLVDALKALYGYSEEDAWQVLSKVNIPICSHIDNHIVGDHEENGCGYAKLVETKPKAVLAAEPIKSVSRLLKISELGGEILHYIGGHQAKLAVINNKQGFSIDQDQLPVLGIFSCDVWAAKYYSHFIKQYDQKVNPKKMANHIEKVFIATVKTLTKGAIKEFIRVG